MVGKLQRMTKRNHLSRIRNVIRFKSKIIYEITKP